MSPTFAQRVSAEVQAVQWNNDVASLLQIQQLIFPLSPYRCMSAGVDPGATIGQPSKSLGIPTTTVRTYTQSELEFIEPGGWVVKYPTSRIVVYKDADFQLLFQATGDAVMPDVPPPAPGATDNATNAPKDALPQEIAPLF